MAKVIARGACVRIALVLLSLMVGPCSDPSICFAQQLLSYGKLLDNWRNAVVLIYSSGELGTKKGTGFLLYTGSTDDPVVIVTCKHLFYEDGKWQDNAIVRLNNIVESESDKRSAPMAMPLIDTLTSKTLWFTAQDSTLDLAIMSISYVKHFPNFDFGTKALPFSSFLPDSCSLPTGQQVFYYGFPLDVVGIQENAPVLRSGVISLNAPQELGGCKFLIDAFAFPGNSGGPVFMATDSASFVHHSLVLTKRLMFVGITSAARIRQEKYFMHGDSASVTIPQYLGISDVISGACIRDAVETPRHPFVPRTK